MTLALVPRRATQGRITNHTVTPIATAPRTTPTRAMTASPMIRAVGYTGWGPGARSEGDLD